MKNYKNILLNIYILVLVSCIPTKENQINMININSFGATPNSDIDDTNAIQKAIDNAYESKTSKVFFPKGTYYCNSITIYPGLELIGEDGTILKKIPNAGKWSRMFTTYSTKYKYSSLEDSPILKIQNITFDGNYNNQGNYERYELEQQHLIFLGAAPKSKGKVRAVIQNCHFRESVGDGISVYSNSHVTIQNCSAENVFRGGLTITGGNSTTRLNGFKAWGDKHLTGIDIEIDGRGYDNSFDVDVELKNVELAGDFDIAIKGGHVTVDSLISYSSPFNLYAVKGEIKIYNSIFHLTKKSNNIYFPKYILFDNCKFYTNNEGNGLNIINNTSYVRSEKNHLEFKNSFFENKSHTNNSYGLRVSPDDIENKNFIIVDKCNFKNFSKGIWLQQGGTVQIQNSEFECEKGIVLNSTAKYNYYFDIKDSDLKKTMIPIKTQNSTSKSVRKESNLRISSGN